MCNPCAGLTLHTLRVAATLARQDLASLSPEQRVDVVDEQLSGVNQNAACLALLIAARPSPHAAPRRHARDVCSTSTCVLCKQATREQAFLITAGALRHCFSGSGGDCRDGSMAQAALRLLKASDSPIWLRCTSSRKGSVCTSGPSN